MPEVDLTKPSLGALSIILRDKTKWPAGFHWDYRERKNCALGLYRQIWNAEGLSAWGIAKELGTDNGFAQRAFFGSHFNGDFTEITPEMVADIIDEEIGRAK